MRYIFILISFAALGFLLTNFTVERYGITDEQNFTGINDPIVGVLFLFAAMLIGVLFGVTFRLIKASRQFTGLFPAIKRAVSSREFALSLLVSPIVFWGIYEATKGNPLLGSSLILSFQNGFFCYSIFERAGKNVPEE